MTRCRVCGCTQENARNPPCAWERGRGDLCTNCAEAVDAVITWMDGAVRPNLTGLVREVKNHRADTEKEYSAAVARGKELRR